MKCGRCQHENLADAAFCDECGARLEAACPSCGEANRAGAPYLPLLELLRDIFGIANGEP
jgi:hypothetical protein